MANAYSGKFFDRTLSVDTLTKKLGNRRIDAIVIGASAGGIRALMKILGTLPAHCQVPIIIVVHMPDSRESRLAEVFQHHFAMAVRMAEDKHRIAPGHIYFAGSGYHLSIERDRSFSLSCEEPVHYSRPSIDILMSSAADAYGASLAGILLTGANQDGAEGMACINKAGGLTIIQDPHEAEMAIMPQAALDLFTPDFVLPLEEIRQLIFKLEIS
ncbi:chemotaxis protein CheB [Cellvibrio mixtus]|uniref:chemotaxis protein CheB n=1 Tax=Cellvibrio mixtus TaxID=39650 RepID=UPI000A021D12|nr:chemotaxis protein CheB [Cellvibrio mixtus]